MSRTPKPANIARKAIDPGAFGRTGGGDLKILSATASAKINLALHITGQREDGYHLLETACVFTDFGDRLTVAASAHDVCIIKGPYSASLTDDGNLIIRARDALRRAFPRQNCQPVSIVLEKNLPVAAGIGGGSSDAAATLKLLTRLWALDHHAGQMADIGLALGADVPMCLAANPLIARGIGDRLELLPDFPKLDIVLVNPGIPVSTANVFQHVENKLNMGLAKPPADGSQAQIASWLGKTRNDLQEPAIHLAPGIATALDVLNDKGAVFARMSGSGATVFGLFDGEAAAQSAAKSIASERPQWFVVATGTGAGMK